MIAKVYFNLVLLKDNLFRRYVLLNAGLLFDINNIFSICFEDDKPFVWFILKESVSIDTFVKYFEKYTYKIVLNK